ncbi:hypothetical protein TNCV_229151 [Trichonephila clavipes]|nr:hypothetical protein TNCV_229151 [Trichonephila clavipes]
MTLKSNQPFLSRSINSHIYSHMLPRVYQSAKSFLAKKVTHFCQEKVSIWRQFNDAMSPSSSAKEFSGCEISLIQIRDNGISRDAALARPRLVGWNISLDGFSIFSSGYRESNFSASRWCAVGLFE